MADALRVPAMLLGLLIFAGLAVAAPSPQDVHFPTADGGSVDADLYGSGGRGVVFAHGAIFDKQSWAPLAERLASHGMRALAIDFRGYGSSRAGRDHGAFYLDVMAAVRWLHAHGVKSVSVVGGSMGGGAAARAATRLAAGEIDKLVLLSPVPIPDPERIKARSILYIASRDEVLSPIVQEQYASAPERKRLVLLPGSAHAQNIFATPEGAHLGDVIVNFLTGAD